MKKLKITKVENGYMVESADQGNSMRTFVYESFDSLSAGLKKLFEERED